MHVDVLEVEVIVNAEGVNRPKDVRVTVFVNGQVTAVYLHLKALASALDLNLQAYTHTHTLSVRQTGLGNSGRVQRLRPGRTVQERRESFGSLAPPSPTSYTGSCSLLSPFR